VVRAVMMILLLAGCSKADEGEGKEEGEPKGAGKAAPIFRADGALASLTGLYEGGPDLAPSQLCIIDEKQEIRFALLMRRDAEKSCSGGGTLVRDGGTLRFTMAGESACAFDAALNGRTVTVSGPVPPSCSYYCTAGTSLDGANFTLHGASIEDARRARDLVGEPLCGER
jgi:hypothetical protein